SLEGFLLRHSGFVAGGAWGVATQRISRRPGKANLGTRDKIESGILPLTRNLLSARWPVVLFPPAFLPGRRPALEPTFRPRGRRARPGRPAAPAPRGRNGLQGRPRRHSRPRTRRRTTGSRAPGAGPGRGRRAPPTPGRASPGQRSGG